MKHLGLVLLLLGLAAFVALILISARRKSSGTSEQAVLVHLTFSSSEDVERIHALEEELRSDIAGARVGELDGDEFGIEDKSCTIFLYGPDADKLFAAVEKTLRSFKAPQGRYKAVKQYGSPGARQVVIALR